VNNFELPLDPINRVQYLPRFAALTVVYLTTPAALDIHVCIQKIPDWPPGARTANGIALCH